MIYIHIQKSSSRLHQFEAIIRKKARDAIQKIKATIPIQNVDIVIYDNPGGTIPELGIGGYAPSAYLIFVSLDPLFPAFHKTINSELERTLAHELHHCMRWNSVGYGETLLEALVSEGLADHFDIEITHKKRQLWDKALTSKQIVFLMPRAEKEYHNTKYNHWEWFFGSKERKIPKWAGYTIGYVLVGNYLKKHPEFKASQLHDRKAVDFV